MVAEERTGQQAERQARHGQGYYMNPYQLGRDYLGDGLWGEHRQVP